MLQLLDACRQSNIVYRGQNTYQDQTMLFTARSARVAKLLLGKRLYHFIYRLNEQSSRYAPQITVVTRYLF